MVPACRSVCILNREFGHEYLRIDDPALAPAQPNLPRYIPAFGSFTLTQVSAGKYDIRYRDLSNGGLSRTECFILDEVDIGGATQYSDLTMTLYKVVNGDMRTYGLSEAEF